MLAARIKKNFIELKAVDPEDKQLKGVTIKLFLNDDMLDLDGPISIKLNGREQLIDPPTRSIENLAKTLDQRGDPTYAFPVVVPIKL